MTQLPEHDEHGATPTPTGEDSPVVAIVGMVVGAVTFVLVFLIWKAFLDRDDFMKLLDFIFGAGLVKAILLYSAVTLGVAFLPKAFRFIAGLLTGMFLGAFPFFGGIVLFVFVGGAISLAGGNPILGMGPPNMSQARQRMLETACSTFLVAGLYLGAACLLITACVAPRWLKRSIRRSGRMLVQPSSANTTTKWIVVLIVFAVVPKTFAMWNCGGSGYTYREFQPERCDGNEKDSIHGNKVDVCTQSEQIIKADRCL